MGSGRVSLPSTRMRSVTGCEADATQCSFAAEKRMRSPPWGEERSTIVVNAGVSHLSPAWLDALAAGNGRLLVPLTGADWSGAFLLITRTAGWTRRYPAKFASRTGIIACVVAGDGWWLSTIPISSDAD